MNSVVQTGIVFPKGTVKPGSSQLFLFLIFVCLFVGCLVCFSSVKAESTDFLFQIFLEWCNGSVSTLNQNPETFPLRSTGPVCLKIIDIKLIQTFVNEFKTNYAYASVSFTFNFTGVSWIIQLR